LRSTLAALILETSCSLEAPPNRTATLHFDGFSTVLSPFARKVLRAVLYRSPQGRAAGCPKDRKRLPQSRPQSGAPRPNDHPVSDPPKSMPAQDARRRSPGLPIYMRTAACFMFYRRTFYIYHKYWVLSTKYVVPKGSDARKIHIFFKKGGPGPEKREKKLDIPQPVRYNNQCTEYCAFAAV